MVRATNLSVKNILLAPSKEKMSREVFSGGESSGVSINNFHLTTRGYCSISYARVELMFDFTGSALFFKIPVSRNWLFKLSVVQKIRFYMALFMSWCRGNL